MTSNKQIEYKCSYCGKTIRKYQSTGRPDPGTCPRKGKSKDGRTKPHSWVINKRF